MQPDVLDRLGLAITEVGAVQVAVEAAQLHWPSGAVRVTALLQSVVDAQVPVELDLRASAAHGARQVQLQAGEVRRVRLELGLPGGVEPLALEVRCTLPQAERIRPSWVRGPAPAPRTDGVIRAALRQALGKKTVAPPPVAPERATIAVSLHAVGGEPPLATAEEAMWQPGMPLPEARELRAEAWRPVATGAMAADTTGERPECRNCLTRQYLEVVRALQSCPTCGHRWEA